jgi:hypothetical protein
MHVVISQLAKAVKIPCAIDSHEFELTTRKSQSSPLTRYNDTATR